MRLVSMVTATAPGPTAVRMVVRVGRLTGRDDDARADTGSASEASPSCATT